MDNQVAMEAFRRRAARQQGGGANQLAGGGGRPQPMQPPQMMSRPGMEQLQKSQPDEAILIVKALIQRLQQFPPYKPQTQPAGA